MQTKISTRTSHVHPLKINATITLKQLRSEVKKLAKTGKSKHQIGKLYGVAPIEITRIESGKYPGEKVAARLGLKVKCSRCKRTLPPPRLPRVRPPLIGRGDGWFEFYSRKLK